jgi:hypothetical protein
MTKTSNSGQSGNSKDNTEKENNKTGKNFDNLSSALKQNIKRRKAAKKNKFDG